MNKVDIFILKTTPYSAEAFNRRRKDTLDEEQELEFYLATPEDTILHKLDWFRIGGQVSERQWTDVLGVLKVQHEQLDMDYLRHRATELDLTDLLEKACEDARLYTSSPNPCQQESLLTSNFCSSSSVASVSGRWRPPEALTISIAS